MFDFNLDKDLSLKESRGVGFDDVVDALLNRRLLDDIPNENQDKYPNQRVLVVMINEYVYLCPYVKHGDKMFLKTIYPSRKYTKIYLRKEKYET